MAFKETYYVYAYDYWGGVTYFKTSISTTDLEYRLRKIAASKLNVNETRVYIGQYSRDPFDQGHLPDYLYKKGKWVSATVD